MTKPLRFQACREEGQNVATSFELRGLAAMKPDVLTALGRIFAEEIHRNTKRLAGVAGAETGAISFPQRFGGSLNLHVHYHTLAVDAVFEKHGDSVRVHEAPPPQKSDVAAVVERVHDRALRWLTKHGYIDRRSKEERSNEPPAEAPMDAFTRIALAGGTFLDRPFVLKETEGAELDRKERRFSASLHGFDVHCAVRIGAGDDEGRERLIRYCARPPFALDRIEEMKDGRVSYLMKTLRRGSTHRVMTPVEFLARLAILVPPPYFPLVRYHGVFAARSSWRAMVTPKPPTLARTKATPELCNKAPSNASSSPSLVGPSAPAREPAPTTGTAAAEDISSPPSVRPPIAPALVDALPRAIADSTTLTVKHWHRLLDGDLFATSSRIEWAVLLQRTFGFDALRCPSCDGKMRLLATITDPPAVKKILTHLGVRPDPLPRARARDPTGQTDFGFDAP